MKVTINNEQTDNKQLDYEESFWTGKRTIVYDGVTLTKVKRNLFEYKKDDITETFEVIGNQLYGVSIKMFGKTVEVTRKIKWYEIVMSIFVFVPCVLFGAVGGAIGGLTGFTNLTIIRLVDNIWLKILISIGFACVSLLASYLLACLVLGAFTLIGI